jgi:hypothetical protein
MFSRSVAASGCGLVHMPSHDAPQKIRKALEGLADPAGEITTATREFAKAHDRSQLTVSAIELVRQLESMS